ncbi:hypothetical protein AGMMS50284_4630 [Clostridia bacterium]|nr:hypothetical protein AGMMS50284_4630 [Clostridia bacterium]
MITMSNEYEADLITLIDDEDNEHKFEIIDTLENDNGIYYALFPVYDTPEEQLNADGEYYIFEVVEEDGEELLLEVEDEAILDELSATFEKRFEEFFDEEDEIED